MWIWLENEDYRSVIDSADAPFQTTLAHDCGLATNYQAVSHPSLPNYLAATGGSTFGIADDGDPSVHQVEATSIFAQVQEAGGTWASYEESMPTTCDLSDAPLYAVRHNPATYYVPLRTSCAMFDVPLGTLSDGPLAQALAHASLPTFAFVTPNLCNDGHDCPLSTADRWLAGFLDAVFASPAYRAGDTAIFVTYDEGTSDNHVSTIVAAPSVVPGTRSAEPFTHYSLLRTTEDLLGLPALGAAAGADSMVAPFSL
jgi:phospholipase C